MSRQRVLTGERRLWRLHARFMHGTRASMTIMVAMMLVFVVAGLGFAVDGARYYAFKTKVQNLADSATLGAGAVLGNNTSELLLAAAQKYLDANAIDPELGTVVIDAGSTTYDSSTKSFKLGLNGTMKTTFMKVIGVDQMTVNVTSIALRALPGPIEISLALDATTSMGFTMTGGKTRLQAAQSALSDLITNLSAFNEVKVGVVPFHLRVNVGVANVSQSWVGPAIPLQSFSGCVGTRNSSYWSVLTSPTAPPYPRSQQVSPCPKQIVELTNVSNSAGKARVTSVVGNPSTSGSSSFVPAGLTWAWNLLYNEGDETTIYTQARSKSEMARLGGRKVVIILTDGNNSAGPTSNNGGEPATGAANIARANTMMTEICNNIKTEEVVSFVDPRRGALTSKFKIEIFVVSFVGAELTAAGEALLKSCATAAEYYKPASTVQDVTNAFVDISSKLVRVTLDR